MQRESTDFGKRCLLKKCIKGIYKQTGNLYESEYALQKFAYVVKLYIQIPVCPLFEKEIRQTMLDRKTSWPE